MIGNVREWTQDEYLPYPGGEAADVTFDSSMRVARGGAWDDEDLLDTLLTSRRAMAPDTRLPSLGFRCVKDVK